MSKFVAWLLLAASGVALAENAVQELGDVETIRDQEDLAKTRGPANARMMRRQHDGVAIRAVSVGSDGELDVTQPREDQEDMAKAHETASARMARRQHDGGAILAVSVGSDGEFDVMQPREQDGAEPAMQKEPGVTRFGSVQITSAAGPSLLEQVQLSVAEDGNSASLNISHEGKLFEYKLSAFSAFKHGIVDADWPRTFRSRQEGRWATATIGRGGSSLSGLFEDSQGHVFEVRPHTEHDPEKVSSLLEAHAGHGQFSSVHVIERFTLEELLGKVETTSDGIDEDSDQLELGASAEMPEAQAVAGKNWGGTKAYGGGKCYSGDDNLHTFQVGIYTDEEAARGRNIDTTINQIVSEASFIYENQFNVRLEIKYHMKANNGANGGRLFKQCDGYRDKLGQLNTYTKGKSDKAAGAIHHFTGCSGGRIAGVAYVGTACRDNYAVGVNHLRGTIAFRIFAHELGHNFGAGHSFGKGGLMDYGNGKSNNVYQFIGPRRSEMCSVMRNKVNNCWGNSFQQSADILKDGSTIALKSKYSGKFCALNGKSQLLCNRDEGSNIGDLAKFIVQKTGTRVALKAASTQKYCTAVSATEQGVSYSDDIVCNRANMWNRGKFDVGTKDGGIWLKNVHTGKYCADRGAKKHEHARCPLPLA